MIFLEMVYELVMVREQDLNCAGQCKRKILEIYSFSALSRLALVEVELN